MAKELFSTTPQESGREDGEKNKKPRTFLKTFLLILVTFFLSVIITLVGLVFYIYKANPFNIQACLISSFLNVFSIMNGQSGAGTGITPAKFDHPFLSSEQEVMLENAGIDVSALPTTLSPEMKACGIDALGQDRIDEIINGATPGPLDLLRVKSCL
ncbi:hypothetical protein K8R32_04340 [bacterium]|nr:hypothetical protein [bacterium]